MLSQVRREEEWCEEPEEICRLAFLSEKILHGPCCRSRPRVDHDHDDGELVLVLMFMELFNEQLHKQCSYIYRHSVWH